MSKKIADFSDTPQNIKPDDQVEQPKISKPSVNFNLNEGATDGEFLEALLNTPQTDLLPYESVELPSRGLYYEGWKDSIIKVRPMGMAAEQAMLNQRTAATGENIDQLIMTCCQFPAGFNASDLLVGDMAFLLFYIRGISYGSNYEFVMKCPKCEVSSPFEYDLSNLTQYVRYADPSVREPYRLVLPMISEQCNREVYVGVRFTRRFDIVALLNRRKALDSASGIGRTGKVGSFNQSRVDPDNSNLLLSSIESNIVNAIGSDDPFNIRAFCDRLTSADRQFIRDWLKDNTPGLDPTIDISCPSCKEVTSVALPLTETFFRQKTRRGVRK